jgi:hypothetical protein
VIDAAWELLIALPNAPLAHALVELLSAQGVDCKLVSDTTLLGEGRACRVFVGSAQVHRARRLLAQQDFSDEELTLLATGGLTPDEAEP